MEHSNQLINQSIKDPTFKLFSPQTLLNMVMNNSTGILMEHSMDINFTLEESELRPTAPSSSL